MKDIFEKFFRVPQGDVQAVRGFGLGLYYVSNIIKSMEEVFPCSRNCSQELNLP